MLKIKGELIVERKKETKEQEMRRLVADIFVFVAKYKQS